MWIPEVQAEEILTDREGGGRITVDYAVSYQKDKESGIGITCMWISWKKLDPGPNSKTYLLSLYTLILILLVIVPEPAATVDGALGHSVFVIVTHDAVHHIGKGHGSKLKLILPSSCAPSSLPRCFHASQYWQPVLIFLHMEPVPWFCTTLTVRSWDHQVLEEDRDVLPWLYYDWEPQFICLLFSVFGEVSAQILYLILKIGLSCNY